MNGLMSDVKTNREGAERFIRNMESMGYNSHSSSGGNYTHFTSNGKVSPDYEVIRFEDENFEEYYLVRFRVTLAEKEV